MAVSELPPLAKRPENEASTAAAAALLADPSRRPTCPSGGST
jgi:hypothetical protein